MLVVFLCKQYDSFSDELDCNSCQMWLFSRAIFKTTLQKFSGLVFFQAPCLQQELVFSLLSSSPPPLQHLRWFALYWLRTEVRLRSVLVSWQLVSDIQVWVCVCPCACSACKLTSFLFLYLWLFIASVILITGPAVLPKAMEEFALKSNKGFRWCQVWEVSSAKLIV